MDNLNFLFPLALLIAPILAYVAHKQHWKIIEMF